MDKDSEARKAISAAADQAFKARLYRSELEAQIEAKCEAEQRRREMESVEEERLLRKIEVQRENERTAYLQEIAAIEKKTIIKEENRKRQQEITKRLEEIQIDEARQRDREAEKQKQILLELMYNREFSHPRSSLSSYYSQQPWNWSSRDYVVWFHEWQASLEEIYNNAPLPDLLTMGKKIDAERAKLHEIMRQRMVRENLP